MKAKYLLAALAAAPVTNALAAETAVTFSGQVNVAALAGDALDDLTIVDNNTTGSRFRIRTTTKFGDGFSAGLRYELQAQFAQSNDGTEIGTNSGVGQGALREVRYADVFVAGPFGKFAIGRGDGAANGTSESYGILNFLGGAEAHLLFNGAGSDFSDIDGNSRRNRIRYDTPSFNGLQGVVTLNNEDEQEGAVTFDKTGDFGKVRARAGVTSGDDDESTFDISAAYKFPFGLGLNFSAGSRDNAAGDTTSENIWLMASYDIGKNFTISAGFGTEDELEVDADLGINEEVEHDIGIFSVVWKPAKSTSVYANFGIWENGLAAGQVEADNDDSSIFALGGHYRF